jgi:hypothetical protein
MAGPRVSGNCGQNLPCDIFRPDWRLRHRISSFYDFGCNPEDTLLLSRVGEKIDGNKITKSITAAVKRSDTAGALNLISYLCLLVGGIVCCIGPLMI